MDYVRFGRVFIAGTTAFSSLTAALLYPVGWALHRLRCWRDARHLAELPDYLLDDVGISRCSVPKIGAGEKPADGDFVSWI